MFLRMTEGLLNFLSYLGKYSPLWPFSRAHQCSFPILRRPIWGLKKIDLTKSTPVLSMGMGRICSFSLFLESLIMSLVLRHWYEAIVSTPLKKTIYFLSVTAFVVAVYESDHGGVIGKFRYFYLLRKTCNQWCNARREAVTICSLAVLLCSWSLYLMLYS